MESIESLASSEPQSKSFVPVRTVWRATALVFFFALFSNITSTTMGIITPGLISDAHLTAVQVGTISTVFFWLSIPMALLASRLADTWGPRLVGTVAIGVAAVMNLVFPLSGGFTGLLINRIIVVLGGLPGSNGVANRLLAGTTARERRGFAISLVNVSYPFGVLLMVTLGTVLISAYGWTSWMYLLGVFGLLITIVWLVITRHAHFNASHETSSAGTKPATTGMRDVLRSRTLLGIGLGWGFSAWSFVFLVGWLPLYFVQARHLAFQEAGFGSISPWIGGIIGGLVTGLITDALLQRTNSYRVARIYLAVAGQFIFCICLAAVAFTTSLTAIFILLFVAEFANQISLCMFLIVPVDTLPESAGSATSYIAAVTNLIAAFSPLVTGILFQQQLFNIAFLIAAAFPLVGGVIMLWLVYPGELRPWGETGQGCSEQARRTSLTDNG
jgi:MFS family permease